MPVSSDIYSQIQPAQPINPLAQLAQAYQIQGLQATLQRDQREQDQQNRLLQLVGDPAFSQLPVDQKASRLQGIGAFDQAGKIITTDAAASKDRRAAQQTELEMSIKRHDQASGALMQASRDPSQAPVILQGLVDAGVMDPAYMQKVLQSAARAPNPSQFFMQGAQAAISAKDQQAQMLQAQAQALTARGQDMTQQSSLANNAATVGATIRGQDLVDARQRENNANGRVPSGYRQTADGSLEFIPGGPADPSAAKKASPTEFQGKSAIFGARAQEADRILSGLGTDFSPGGINAKNAASRVPVVGGIAEAGANAMLSTNSQKAEQAQRDFVNAVLRLESGAAIGKDEFDNAKRQYFPQPGDSQEVIAQKAANRKLQIQGLLGNAGNAPIPTPGAAPRGMAAAKAGGAQRITDKAAFDALPSGTVFIAPDGTTRRKP